MKRALAWVVALTVLLAVGAGGWYFLWSTGRVEPTDIVSKLFEPRDKPPIDGPGKTEADFPEPTADLFAPMDGGIKLVGDEIKGRNAWLLWTGGNEQFWDRMSHQSFGLIDFVKTIDSRRRPRRFKEMGFINEPGTAQSDDPDEFGLSIDHPVGPKPEGLDESVYGRSTGARERTGQQI